MRALTFTIRLKEPVLATQPFSGEPNSGTSFAFIPGSMIRGALVAAYMSANGYANGDTEPKDLLKDAKACHLFFDGAVSFLNAYPVEPQSQERLLPKPFSWFVAKDDEDKAEATIYDFAVGVNPELDKPKSPDGEFCWIEDGRATLLSPPRLITVHNASDDRNKKTQGSSQLFRYDALAPDQMLGGVVVAHTEAKLETLKTLLEERVITLGGSHTAGYGRIELVKAEIEEEWAGEYIARSPAGDEVIITLLSDTILRSPNGQISAGLAAGLGLDEAKAGDLALFQRTRVVGGFNRKWGLPLPQAWALQAGSVVRVPADLIGQARLDRWVAQGIGERRTEGFGRIAVNWQTQATYQRQSPGEAQLDPPPASLSSLSQALATRMANQMLRNRLEERLTEELIGKKINLRNLPSSSQLARVRVVARQAQLNGDLYGIWTHLDSLKGARQTWEQARLEQESLFDWVRRHCRLSEDEFKQIFGLSGALPQVAGISSSLPAKLQTEYTARLIDGVMKLAIEQKKKEEDAKRESGGQP